MVRGGCGKHSRRVKNKKRERKNNNKKGCSFAWVNLWNENTLCANVLFFFPAFSFRRY